MPQNPRSLASRFALVAGAASLLAFPLSPSVPAAASGIGFGTPTLADPIHTYGEPDIAINPVTGSWFVSGPTGTGTQRSIWNGSVDGGHSFRIVSPGPPPESLQSSNAGGPGGGDTEISFDSHGNQYFSDLYALSCFRVAVTHDDGKSVAQQSFPGGCGGMPPADRQWNAVFDPPAGTTQSPYKGPLPLVYLTYNNVADGLAAWQMSNDGLNFSNASADGKVHFGADGYPSIDPVTGKVFQVSGNGNELLLNIGTPDAAGKLTFLDAGATPGSTNLPGTYDTSKLIPVARNLPGDPNLLFPVSSMDSGRNLWAAWAIHGTQPADFQVYTAVATAASGWTNWSAPIQVSDGLPSSGDAINVFPWIRAGGPGRADVVWYGADKAVDPSSKSGQAWNLFMNQVVVPTDTAGGALTTATPSTDLNKVSPHPMKYNDICLLGTACVSKTGNRNLADFFSMWVDKDGAAAIVYDDTSNGLVQPGLTPGGVEGADHSGAPVVTVIHQTSGMGLYGHPVGGPTNAAVASMNGRAGDALYPVMGGTNVPGMDLTQSGLALSADGKSLNVTMKVADISNPAATAAAAGNGPLLQYVTRWTMATPQDTAHPYTIFYALAELGGPAPAQFFAGSAQSIDLCSVSACDPHVITYPEAPAPGGNTETGSVNCPASPSAANPCTITIKVDVAHVGGVTSGSLLEEVGAYSFSASHPQAGITNAQAQADNVPLQVDGICCYNWTAGAPQPDIPESPVGIALPVTAGVVGLLALAITVGGVRRRRRGQA